MFNPINEEGERMNTLHLDDELMYDDNYGGLPEEPKPFVKGIHNEKYANIVEAPVANFLTHRDEGRSKFNRGKFYEGCNAYDKYLKYNPRHRYLDYEAPSVGENISPDGAKMLKDRVQPPTHVRVFGAKGGGNFSEGESVVSDTESNRS